MGAFEITREGINGVSLVCFEGELDLDTCDALARELEAAAGDQMPIVLDLERCEFIDSSGIAVLVGAGRALNAGGEPGFAIATGSSEVAKTLEMTGVDEIVSLFRDTNEAVRALAA